MRNRSFYHTGLRVDSVVAEELRKRKGDLSINEYLRQLFGMPPPRRRGRPKERRKKQPA